MGIAIFRKYLLEHLNYPVAVTSALSASCLNTIAITPPPLSMDISFSYHTHIKPAAPLVLSADN
jgi:hypothetical protein